LSNRLSRLFSALAGGGNLKQAPPVFRNLAFSPLAAISRMTAFTPVHHAYALSIRTCPQSRHRQRRRMIEL